MAAVRVKDPKQADVFFVPFFSARSFNNYGHNMLDPEAEIDKGLQVRAFSFLTSHLFWCCFVCMTRAADNIIA
jgi:hypothetical protein